MGWPLIVVTPNAFLAVPFVTSTADERAAPFGPVL
jgi:hypothetical protein